MRANLRDHPSKSGKLLREIRQGDMLILVSSSPVGAWYWVRHKETGTEGWVQGNGIVVTNATASVAARAPQRRERVADGASNIAPSTSTGRPSSGCYYRNVDGDLIPSPVFSIRRLKAPPRSAGTAHIASAGTGKGHVLTTAGWHSGYSALVEV